MTIWPSLVQPAFSQLVISACVITMRSAYHCIGACCQLVIISTEAIHENRALCDKFLKFGIVLAIGMLISKTTAYRLSSYPSGRYAQNPIWLPSNSYIVISQLLFTIWYLMVALYLDFGGQGILIWNYFVVRNCTKQSNHVFNAHFTPEKLS